MDPASSMIKASGEFCSTFSKCLADAVGDDIRADIKRNGYITGNGNHFRIWDFLNTNLCKRLNKQNVVAWPTKRGAWAMVPIFDGSTGILYSVMREARFAHLKKKLSKRFSAHYIDALAHTLNIDLHAKPAQKPLFIFDDPPLRFSDISMQEILQSILRDLKIPGEIVKRHAIILFSSQNNELVSLRCCVVDRNLDVVDEKNWSDFITMHESVVVEEVSEALPAPSAKLQFTQKAKDRIDQKHSAKRKDPRKQEKKNKH